jgi:DNA adenine methylase
VTLALCRYAGSKAGQIPLLLPLMLGQLPTLPARYVTPTLGSGADLYAAIDAGIPEYLAADLNQHLVSAHLEVRDNLDSLLEALRPLAALDDASCRRAYAAQRAWCPTPMEQSADAARFLFLIGCGINGIWRESKKSGYNINYGKRFLLSEERLALCSQRLRRVPGRLICADFAQTLSQARPGDLVYIDPPFVDSTPIYLGRWSLDEHRRLFAAALGAKANGAHVFISNSDKPDTRAIYQGTYHSLAVARTVAPNALRRAPTSEVLIEL